jgi:hypothetical protein
VISPSLAGHLAWVLEVFLAWLEQPQRLPAVGQPVAPARSYVLAVATAALPANYCVGLSSIFFSDLKTFCGHWGRYYIFIIRITNIAELFRQQMDTYGLSPTIQFSHSKHIRFGGEQHFHNPNN